MTSARATRLAQDVRSFSVATPGDEDLGPFKELPGTWTSGETGWNMIALPFGGPGADFRLLLNQYREHLTFSLVDKAIPNRGVSPSGETDQTLVGLDYEQLIKQVATTDQPDSGLKQSVGAGIHHEPGLFLNMVDQVNLGEPTIARLATIPHGDSVLASGTISTTAGLVDIPAVDGLPVGVSQDLVNNKYLAPYAFFHQTPFTGTVNFAGFPGFDPVSPHLLLEFANQALAGQNLEVVNTTTLSFSTAPNGGINNIPFVVKQANATSMNSTFWIQEISDGSLRLQYLQVVTLEFLPRGDGLPGRIAWPHVSINTLTKASGEVQPDPGF